MPRQRGVERGGVQENIATHSKTWLTIPTLDLDQQYRRLRTIMKWEEAEAVSVSVRRAVGCRISGRPASPRHSSLAKRANDEVGPTDSTTFRGCHHTSSDQVVESLRLWLVTVRAVRSGKCGEQALGCASPATYQGEVFELDRPALMLF